MRPHIEQMQRKLKAAIKVPGVANRFKGDLVIAFTSLGMSHRKALALAAEMVRRVQQMKNVEMTETTARNYLSWQKMGNMKFPEAFTEGLASRAQIIFNQVSSYLSNMKGRGIDFGCGRGEVTQMLCTRLGLDMYGCDARQYLFEGARFPFAISDDQGVCYQDHFFSGGLMTNVLHHEVNNEIILAQLHRIIKPGGHLVVIETVPAHDTEVDFALTLLNDWFYNRVPYDADVSVPGTFETKENWVKRFGSSGFTIRSAPVELGFDQPLIQDFHVLYDLTRD